MRQLSALESKEKLVWEACCAHDRAHPWTYVRHDWLRAHVKNGPRGDLTARGYAGAVGSLQRKGYIFAFGRGHDDVEITCDGRWMGGLATNRLGCNGQQCSCRGRAKH